jgi:phospholipid/cholesterol/gamma-HCH transport system substrate-binding protein
MENKDRNRNIKLGAFVLGAIAIFLASVFYLGRESNAFNKTFTVSAVFKNVEGLNEGDNVWLSGVKIGTVKRVQIISEGQVIVNLSLKDKQNEFIKKNATAFVGSDGLVGNKIVVIRPGTADEIIEDNDTINALSPADTQELINIAKEVGSNTRSITDDIKLISSRLNKGEGLFGELLRDGAISQDIRETVALLKSTGKNTNQLAVDAKQLLQEINKGDGLVTKLITDTSYATTFQYTLENIAEVGANSKKMSQDLQNIIAKMNSNNNAVGVLLTDTAFAQKLRGTLDNAKSASVKLDENMEALQHNFLLRGFFRKKEKIKERESNNNTTSVQPHGALNK